MGVRGLTTYVTYNEHLFFKEFLLHDCNLVIDGHSLCAQLYLLFNTNSAFGGDYDRYAAYVRRFFLALRKCKVFSYVLFDGSLERKKLGTAFSRLRSKLNGVSQLYPGNQSNMKLFPLLLRDVFKEVLVNLNILHTTCEFEADDEIAALARHLNCPVLSYDSDFFIYNVLYIPINRLHIKPVMIEEDDKKLFAMECKLYRVEDFLEHFGGLQRELLPVLATLLGNDYVKKRVFRNFFSHLKLPKSCKKKNEQLRCIQGLLEWLRNESFDSAVLKVIGRLKHAEKQHVLCIVQKSCDQYNRTDCPSLNYFNIEADEIDVKKQVLKIKNKDLELEPETSCDEESSDDSSSDTSSVDSTVFEDIGPKFGTDFELPTWMVDAIRHGTIPQPYINMYTHHLYFCIPQAEDFNDQDCFVICLPMLRYAFDIIHNFTEGKLTYVSREGTQFKRIDVPSSVQPPCKSEPHPLENKEHSQKYFEYFLCSVLTDIDFQSIEEAPESFQLILIAILYWIKHSTVTTAHIYSIILCYVMLEIVDEKTGTSRSDFYFNNKNSKKLENIKKKKIPLLQYEGTEMFFNKNKVQYEDCLVCASVLIKLFEMDNEMKKRPKTYDKQWIHKLAQFQCCLQQVNYLNTLCGCKYKPTVYHKTYNGMLTYNLLNKLSSRPDPMEYVFQYLKGADTVLLFFKSLCVLVDKCVKKANINVATTNVYKGKKRRRRKKGTEFICERFEAEVFI